MSDLSPPLRDHLRDPIDDDRAQRLRHRLQASRRRALGARGSRRSAFVLATVAASAVLCTVVVLLLWRIPGQPLQDREPIRLASGALLSTLTVDGGTARPVRFALSDGSIMRLEPGARLEVEQNTGRVVALRLETGAARFEITPRRFDLFRVRAGQVDVDVVGTSFSVSRSPGLVRVEVEEGAVLVSGAPLAAGPRHLIAGQSLSIELAEALPAPRAEAQATPVDAVDAGAEQTRPERDRGVPPTWRALARQREFERAYDLLGASGVARESRSTEGPGDLYALADVARLSGHPADAVAPLERLVEAFPDDRRAAVAAFTLGRIRLDALGEPARAARDLERALRLGPPPGLREDVHARLVEARARAGDVEGARAAARGYLRLFPQGRHAERIGHQLETGSP